MRGGGKCAAERARQGAEGQVHGGEAGSFSLGQLRQGLVNFLGCVGEAHVGQGLGQAHPAGGIRQQL